MQTEYIIISNLSCGGCINTITKKLNTIAGVETVNVHIETNTVTVIHNESVSRKKLTETLCSIGYPETAGKNGILTQLKSISSCLTGNFS